MSQQKIQASYPAGIIPFWDAVTHTGRHLIKNYTRAYIEDYREILAIEKEYDLRSRWEAITGSIKNGNNAFQDIQTFCNIFSKSKGESPALQIMAAKIASYSLDDFIEKYDHYESTLYVVSFIKSQLLKNKIINIYTQREHMTILPNDYMKPFQWNEVIEQIEPFVIFENNSYLIYLHTGEIDQYFYLSSNLSKNDKYNFFRFRGSDIVEGIATVNETYYNKDIADIPVDERDFLKLLNLPETLNPTKQEELKKIIREAQGKNNKKNSD